MIVAALRLVELAEELTCEMGWPPTRSRNGIISYLREAFRLGQAARDGEIEKAIIELSLKFQALRDAELAAHGESVVYAGRCSSERNAVTEAMIKLLELVTPDHANNASEGGFSDVEGQVDGSMDKSDEPRLGPNVSPMNPTGWDEV